jgi:ribosome recycling factor
MSVKHIKEYYEEVSAQYHELLNELKDFEKEAQEGMIEPERLDMIKENIKPLTNNYQTLSWIMFLLNKPNKKQKHKTYERQNQKRLNSLDKRFSKEGVINTNNDTLDRLKADFKGNNTNN